MASNSPSPRTLLIDFHKVSLVKEVKQRITKLFNVQIEFEEIFSSAEGKNQWISLEGESATEEQYRNATEYILSLVRPEISISIGNMTLPRYMRDIIEEKSAVYIVEQDGTVTIQGSELNVALARSSLLQLIEEGGKSRASPCNEERSKAITHKQNRLNNHNSHMQHSKPSTSSQRSSPCSISQAYGSNQTATPKTILKPVRRAAEHADSTAVFGGTSPDFASSFRRISPDFESSDHHATNNFRVSNGDSRVTSTTTTLTPRPPDPTRFQPIEGNGRNFTPRSDRQPAALSNASCNAHSPQSSSSPSDDINDRCLAQVKYLKNLGISVGFAITEIEEALLQFDMNEVIKPVNFRSTLEQLRDINQSLNDSNDASSNASASCVPPSIAAVGVASSFAHPNLSPVHRSSYPNPNLEPPESSETTAIPKKNVIVISSDEEEDVIIESESDWNTEVAMETTNASDENTNAQSKYNTITGLLPDPIASTSAVPQTGVPHLRYVVIDGSNVAVSHGNSKVYSVRGIQICLKYFLDRGHRVTAFVPQSRLYSANRFPIKDRHLLDKLSKDGLLKFTPARRINGRAIVSYDDRYILDLAESEQGIVVSNDQFRDLINEKPTYKNIIETRLLPYVFVDDHFMPPYDPLGRNGPKLEEFLCMPGYFGSRSRFQAQRTSTSREQQFVQLPAAAPFPHNTAPFPRSTAPFPRSTAPFHHNTAPFPRNTAPFPHNNERSKQDTDEIFEKLLLIFPEQHQRKLVWNVLQNHQTETDLSRLSNYCLNAI